jgi:predicted nucleic-acid-binding Zn-ribbon protein
MEAELQSGICPKCHHAEVYMMADADHKIFPDHYYGAVAWQWRPKVDELVCTNCGYVELYVREEDVSRIRKEWTHVHPQQR